MTTSAGQKVTVDDASSTKYKKGSSSISSSAIKKGQHVLVVGTVKFNDHQGHPGHRRNYWDRWIRSFHSGSGDPLPKGCSDHVKAGRSDPS